MIGEPWGVRRRIQLLCAVAVAIGLVVPGLARWGLDALADAGALCRDPGPVVDAVCGQAERSPALSRALVAVLTGGLVLLALLLASGSLVAWGLRPLRELVPPVARLGPQNLGQRIRAQGEDEVARLAGAIDAMLDRVAEGYEGQRRFAANASHELRTPLAVQRVLIEVGLSAPMTPEQVELLTRQLLATNERNERLIEGLLVLSETDQGLRSRTPQRLDLVTAAVVAAHQDRAAAAGVVLTCALDPRVVPGEQVLLERLVTNLVQNAVTYNRPGGTVEVAVGADPALTIVNTGPLVPAEAVAGLFEPFRRLSGERVDQGSGAGLGLTIARSITAAHGGSVLAQPRPGGGLRLEVRLPSDSTGTTDNPAGARREPPADGTDRFR